MIEHHYVDTHAHVQMAEFDADRLSVLARAQEAGIDWLVCPGVDVATSRMAVSLAEQEPVLRAAVGVHPEDCASAPADYLEQLRKLASLQGHAVVAIGEIGLDYKAGTPDVRLQQRFFEEQLQLASDLRLPVIVHSREAVQACLDAIRHFPNLRGVMHCFGGTRAQLEQAVGLNFCVSFTGNITYPGASAVRDALVACPLGALLLETDAPYMPPVPHRGKRNEPAFVAYTYAAAAALVGTDVDELGITTHKTACQLFNIPERREHGREEKVQDYAQP